VPAGDFLYILMLKKDFTHGWTQVPNHIINCEKLSLKAKALWMYINSKPEGWDFAVWRIAKQTKEGEKAVRSGLNELAKSGYLSYQPKFKENGQLDGQHYILSDVPKPCTPKSVYPKREGDGNGVRISNTVTSKKETVKKSEVLYTVWNSVNQFKDWEEYFVWVCENKKDGKDTIYKDIAWKDWFRKDYNISKIQKEKAAEPSYNPSYPHQLYQPKPQPQLSEEEREANRKHFAEMIKKVKSNLNKI